MLKIKYLQMKRILLLSFVLFFGLSVFAQSETLKHANELYAAGNFTDAAKQYETILANEGVSPELYYNLANAYYKTNEVGRSILNYERALRLSPTFADAKFNLELAQQKVVDNIIQAPTFFLGRWIENLIKILSSNQWFYISLSLFVLGLVVAFLFIFGTTKGLRKTSFYISGILLGISLLTFIFAGVMRQFTNVKNFIAEELNSMIYFYYYYYYYPYG
jgi:tetratricopeptide (TPR) repeat protein